MIGLINLLKISKPLSKELKQAKLRPHSKKFKIIIALTTILLFGVGFYSYSLLTLDKIKDTTFFLLLILSIAFIGVVRYLLFKIFKVKDVQGTKYGKYLRKKFSNRK